MPRLRERRVDPAHAWGVVAVGTAGLAAIPTILATLHATDPHFRWWWPTSWMAIPAAIFLLGAAMVALSARRRRAPQPTVGAVGRTAAGTADANSPRSAESGSEGGSADSGLAGGMGEAVGHVFLSAAVEDADCADRLQRQLQAAGIRVWRDVVDLAPGDYQPAAIRRAIGDGALVFLACFSSRSSALVKSYVNVQLLLAIEQQRMRRPGLPWLIPVRFDDHPLPDVDLGGGRTLAALTPANLYGPHRDDQAERLLAAVRRILGPSAGAECKQATRL